MNESRMRAFPYSNAFFPTPGLSDHSPSVVNLSPPPKPSTKPFRFFDFLADHPLFLPTVQRVWRTIVLGNPMFCISEKLRSLQVEFKKLNTQEFSAISDRVKNAKLQLDVLQKEMGSNPLNPSIQAEEKDAFRQYLILSRAEESLAKQKSRIQWLKLGDLCTSFFFKSVSNNRNRSMITSLTLSDSSSTQDIPVIKSTFVNFYHDLLGTPHGSHYDGAPRVNELIQRKLTDEQNLAMVQTITDAEMMLKLKKPSLT